jgi:hypothetical protein
MTDNRARRDGKRRPGSASRPKIKKEVLKDLNPNEERKGQVQGGAMRRNTGGANCTDAGCE